MTLLTLMLEFFKTGLFSVGGGLATLPFLYEMTVNHPAWFTTQDIADMIAVSESTPGAIGINMSTYAGFRTLMNESGSYLVGIGGGILASLALAAPSVIVILIIAKFLHKFRSNHLVEGAFYGLRPASIAMITAAGLNVVKVALVRLDAWGAIQTALQNGDFAAALTGAGDFFIWKALILAVLIFVGQRKLKWSPVLFIAISAVVGIIFKF